MQRSRRMAHLAVAVALSIVVMGYAHQPTGRHLLNPIYQESNKFVGPETPSFRYKTNPSPASYKSDLKVRSEKPWVAVEHKEKDWFNAKSTTKLDTWEGAKFNYKAGKGQTVCKGKGKGGCSIVPGPAYSVYKFDSGKRAFEFNNKDEYKVNFPETDIKIAGGQPILVDQKVAVTGATANETIAFATGDGPSYENKWAVNVGSTQFGHGRRRSLLAFLGRHLLNPIYQESNKFVGPETPSFRYKTNPSPASYKSDLKVRSEKPWVAVEHKEKDWFNAKSTTKLDTWEGAKFNYKAGKGQTVCKGKGKGGCSIVPGPAYSVYKFDSGKRAFEFNNKDEYKVNFPETDIKIAGGQPILVDQKVAVTGATANETIAFATGDGPSYENKWAVNVGSTQFGHGRRRSLLSFLGRHLLNPIYQESNKFVGPETPSFRYKTNPSPASYKSDLKVRSEKPWVAVEHKEKDWFNAKSTTKLDTWEGAKFNYKAGKGQTVCKGKGKGGCSIVPGPAYSVYKFDSGKRAFEFNNKDEYKVNFPETDIKIAGGQPILVDQKVAVTGATANETIAFATGDGPSYENKWAVNVGSTQFGHGRRRRS